LYQVATGGLSPANIAAPLRAILRRQKNVEVLLGEVVDIDVADGKVLTTSAAIPYDTLIVAAGSRPFYFGHPEWEATAPSLKTIDDATLIRRKLLLAFEAAELEPAHREEWLTFVLVGGGPTGVELAGTIAELARHTLRDDFRVIDTSTARVLLIEGRDRILPTYDAALSHKGRQALERLGVEVWTGAVVKEVRHDSVLVEREGAAVCVSSRNTLWTAGVAASPLGQVLADRAGAALDRGGRVIVQADLTVPGHPDIYVIGDLAHFQHGDLQTPLPGVAPVAMQQGRYVARAIGHRLRGRPVKPFRYFNRGDMATIGRGAAVADIRGWRFSGYLAWLLWLFVHLLFLVEFENRLLVLSQWAYSYITRNRAARLITGPSPFPLAVEHERVAARIKEERRAATRADAQPRSGPSSPVLEPDDS
jgi:NADH dehydrogenase